VSFSATKPFRHRKGNHFRLGQKPAHFQYSTENETVSFWDESSHYPTKLFFNKTIFIQLEKKSHSLNRRSAALFFRRSFCGFMQKRSKKKNRQKQQNEARFNVQIFFALLFGNLKPNF
jgi:hypothetical protein